MSYLLMIYMAGTWQMVLEVPTKWDCEHAQELVIKTPTRCDKLWRI